MPNEEAVNKENGKRNHLDVLKSIRLVSPAERCQIINAIAKKGVY